MRVEFPDRPTRERPDAMGLFPKFTRFRSFPNKPNADDQREIHATNVHHAEHAHPKLVRPRAFFQTMDTRPPRVT